MSQKTLVNTVAKHSQIEMYIKTINSHVEMFTEVVSNVQNVCMCSQTLID